MGIKLTVKSGRSETVPMQNVGYSPSELGPEILSQVEASGVGSFWATDEHGNLVYLSPGALASLGGSAGKLLGAPIATIFVDAEDDEEQTNIRPLSFSVVSKSKIENQIVQVQAPSEVDSGRQNPRWWRISGTPFFDQDGIFRGYRGNCVDITLEYRHQQDVNRQSQFDELTGLANRRRLNGRLKTILSAYQAAGRSCALMMLDLDRFKQVNDTMGHPAGDELLKQVGDRLKSLVKDRGEVGRLGGDEFQIILPDFDDRGELGNLASRIIQLLSQPYSINGRRAMIGTSIGIAIAPYDGLETTDLNRAVDLALYAAKESGRGTYRFYTAQLREEAARGADVQDQLRDALEKGEFKLNYQPLVNPHDGNVKCFEALMRWDRPGADNISPAVFIPIAEQSDLIVKLGDWALHQACMDATKWPDRIRLAVNVSAKQFMTADFCKAVDSALRKSGLNPSRLELEITESVFVGEVDSVDTTFAKLKKMGVRLALDDFGTGYSSLGYLKRAPFDKIKIDQSFVRGCTESGDTNPAIISAIVAIAGALGMETVAEGVEAMDELELVSERGADLVQGFIYSKPIPQEDLIERFDKGLHSFTPDGPPRYRSDRYTSYRKVGLIHEDHYYDIMLRNISKSGARIEGLADVPVGTKVVLDLGGGQLAVAKVAHSTPTSQGVEFEVPLVNDGTNGLVTSRRVSPYALAEAGMPLAALGPGSYPMSQVEDGEKLPPKFVQLELGSRAA
ncbi:EAL domain-containing protein [Altererythrobacter sp. MF3-039]|uniref:EAL domain-containing protein n=1 Tax=Altererythrobacter sp. MF3-039 TaxID=3252901 RepID=UPI00390C91A8